MGRWYVRKINQAAWEKRRPGPLNERTVEYGFVFACLARLAPRTVLDVGTGATALPSLLETCKYQVTAIDNIKDYWPRGMFNQHFHVINDDITHSKMSQQFDAVLCISVLEHVAEYERALTTMASLTRPGGHIIITCPYNENIGSANVYEEQGSYGKGAHIICRQFTQGDFQEWLARSRATIINQEWWQFFDSNYWSCGRLVMPPNPVSPNQQHQHTCMLIRKAE